MKLKRTGWQRIGQALASVLIALTVGGPGQAQAAAIDDKAVPVATSFQPWQAGFSAVYEVKKGSFTIGETKRTLSLQGDNHYLFESITRPAGFGRLLTSGQVIERSEWRFRPQDHLIQPLTYTYFNSGSEKNRDAHLTFDWQTHTVTNTINGQPWKMPLVDGTQDKLVYQLRVMADLLNGNRQLNYPVADGGKLKTYQLQIVGKETIRTDLGLFETLRIRRVHGKRVTTLWCAKQLSYLPVRIEQRKGNDSPIKAILTSVKGL